MLYLKISEFIYIALSIYTYIKWANRIPFRDVHAYENSFTKT